MTEGEDASSPQLRQSTQDLFLAGGRGAILHEDYQECLVS